MRSALMRRRGKILHDIKLFHSDSPEPLGNNTNGYATPTPAIEPGRVYVHFGSYGTACLDTSTGNVLWKRDDLPCRHYRGPSSSVVLFEDLVILTFDGVDQQYVTALDKETGKTVWRTDRKVAWNDQDVTGKGAEEAKRLQDGDHRKAHSTPLVIKTPAGQWQLVSGGAKAAFGYDPRTGDEIWRIEFDDFSVAPRPIYHDGVIYLVTGNTHPELWAIRADGTGNLTETANILWRLKSRVAHTASPTFVDGLIYMASDEGIINCIDAANGTDGVAEARRRFVRGIANLRRWPTLLLRSRRPVNDYQAWPQIRFGGDQLARRWSDGVARGRWSLRCFCAPRRICIVSKIQRLPLTSHRLFAQREIRDRPQEFGPG